MSKSSQNKPLHNRDIKPTDEIKVAELSIHRTWKKIIDRIRQIPHVYWLIIITVLLAVLLNIIPNYAWTVFLSGLKSQGMLVSLVIIFGLVAISLVWSVGQRIDVWVFLYFNMHGRREPWLDWIMLCFTQIGSGLFAMIITIIFFISGNQLLAYEFALGTLTLWMVVELIKITVNRRRPYVRLENSRIVSSAASGYSFPNGHTSQTFFMITLLSHYYQLSFLLWLGMIALALLVWITRIYVGMHYPRDVLGGAILGTAWGLLGMLINNSF